MRLLPSSKPAWDALRPRVLEALEAWPAIGFTVAGPDDTPAVAWEDGPAEGSVAAAVGDVAGWRVESAALGPDPDAPRASSVLLLDRRLSVEALAVGVVRYQASHTRPYDPSRPGAREALWAILEEDDPAACPYPLPAAMARALLDGWTGGADAAGLAARLTELGYDRLWNRAWAGVAL